MNEFEFYLRQAIALAVLPRAQYLQKYHEDLCFSSAVEVLEQIEKACNAQAETDPVSMLVRRARPQLDALVLDLASYDVDAHIRSLREIYATHRVKLHSEANRKFVDNLLEERTLRLTKSILDAIEARPGDDKMISAKLVFRLGVTLDQFLHPSEVVEFMNLSWDRKVIALHSTWVLGMHGIIAHLQPYEESLTLPVDVADETWRIIRHFDGGDFLPSEDLHAQFVEQVHQCTLQTHLKYELEKLLEFAPSPNWLRSQKRLDHTRRREDLIQLVGQILSVLESKIANPSSESNDERDSWMYTQRYVLHKTNKQIRAGLKEAGYDVIESDAGVSKAIKRYAERTGKPLLPSPRGRKRKA